MLALETGVFALETGVVASETGVLAFLKVLGLELGLPLTRERVYERVRVRMNPCTLAPLLEFTAPPRG